MSQDNLEIGLPTLNVINPSGEETIPHPLPTGYIPKNERKTILLLSDDLRMPSGVGVMSREIVLGTAHRYNWVQLGAGINHPEVGKIMDASVSLSQELGIPDAYLRIYPYNGYGDANIIRQLMMVERPDVILHFTDPRYWIWLYQMEAELRESVPILFYHVWDDLPFPKYNKLYYQSCDAIACISRQTYNIVKNVVDEERDDWQLKYIPHGVNSDIFRAIAGDEELKKKEELKKTLFGEDEVDFVVLYNNRNIRRKMTGDVILAYREFVKTLPKDKADKCRLLFHTQEVDDNGTDLIALIRDCAPNIKYAFTRTKYEPPAMNLLYNLSDVVINLASNEGFGLGTLEGIMAERMVVANVTGGLQDQMGFKDENGNYINEDEHYNSSWGSNHDGRYKDHGEWVLPVFPAQRALIGSPPTPYIFDDRCKWEDAAVALRTIYDMPKEERERRGKLGREYCMTQGFHHREMNSRFMKFFEDTFDNWTPRKRWDLYRV